jgi:AcrR family transcriptional regulator
VRRAAGGSSTADGARRAGRPPRIDLAAIALVAGDMPLEELSIRSVADRLGVSVAALYHYVSGREELMLLAAEQSAAKIPLPEDRGQHWAVWLFEWADYARRAFVSQPQLLAQFTDGGLGLDRMVDHIDTAIGLCVRQGFAEREALDAYYLISGFAIGAAVKEIRIRSMAAAGRPVDVEYRVLLARRSAADLPHLRRLVDSGLGAEAEFLQEVTTALIGIAAQRGEAWEELVPLVESAARQPARRAEPR